jgi:asparagine synthase (glutamine-hydrolysing)
MCGIAGKLTSPTGGAMDPRLLERMCVALEHRGPDSRGTFVEGPVGLGIQRLRVMDLATGDQPIYNEDRSVVVVLNGEIYNFKELRDDLVRRGHTFSTKGDTETIVHAYEEYGLDCVRHLHGMFAFALWDKRRRRLLIARDRIGKKPLFYSIGPSGLSFASELRSLIQDPAIARDVDPGAVDCFLAYGYVPAPYSIFSSVSKLPPAHTLVMENGRAALERYWQLDYSQKVSVSDPRELHEPILDAIRVATRKRLVSDVPLGAFLSGGIDSSAVVAAMAEASSNPVKTFSIGFDHDAFNELPQARQVAELFSTDHYEFLVRADAVEIVPRMVRHYGEPFADASAIPSFYLAEMTRRHVTVALNGDGGDESFSGYTRYVSNRLAEQLERVPAALRRAAAMAAGRHAPGEITSLTNKARRLAEGLPLDQSSRYALYVSWFKERQRAQLYTEEFAALTARSPARDVIEGPWRAASGEHILDKMLEVDVCTYLQGDLIPKIDIATMAHSLEARSPLLDHQLMEFAASIPAKFKVRGREKKWILREALRQWLPADVLDRPKRGFTPPLGHWFRNELRDLSREVLLDQRSMARSYFKPAEVEAMLDRHHSGKTDETKRLWALFVLELWHREFIDGAPTTNMLEEAAAA